MTTSSLLKLIMQARTYSTSTQSRLNCHVASITKVRRKAYARTYPTILVYNDGSSTVIRYHEPRQIITLPLDITTLSEAEQKKVLDARRPKTKVVVQEDIEVGFDPTSYQHLWKNNKQNK